MNVDTVTPAESTCVCAHAVTRVEFDPKYASGLITRSMEGLHQRKLLALLSHCGFCILRKQWLIQRCSGIWVSKLRWYSVTTNVDHSLLSVEADSVKGANQRASLLVVRKCLKLSLVVTSSAPCWCAPIEVQLSGGAGVSLIKQCCMCMQVDNKCVLCCR